jgi:hypothetical protein
MSQTTEKRSRFAHFGGWIAELVLVFVGVSAAFWLSNYQQHRQDAERRDRILAWIEQTLREGIEGSKINRVNQEREAAEFKGALEAGEMPALRPFVFITDYTPGDFATWLQSGGYTAAGPGDAHRVAQRRVGYPLGTPADGTLSKVKRRIDRSESRPGQFLLLRCDHQEITKAIRDLSRSSGSNCEIC